MACPRKPRGKMNGRTHLLAILAMLLATLMLSAFTLALAGDDMDDEESGLVEDDIASSIDKEIVDAGKEGRFKIVLVGPNGKPIDDKLFTRRIPGQYSIRAFPRVFTLDGKDLFKTGLKMDSALSKDTVTIFCKGPDDNEAVTYVPQVGANIPPGKYSIAPFGLGFEARENLRPDHAALSYDKGTLNIHLVPVTFIGVDKAKGYQVAIRDLSLYQGKTDLLANLIPETEKAGYCPLTIYLPRGLEYASSAGNFRIDDDGKIEVLSKNAPFKDVTFTVVQESVSSKVQPVGKGLWVMPHTVRRVFKRGEVATFQVIASGDYPKGALEVVARQGQKEFALGSVAMPAIKGKDSRLFLLDTGVLAPGAYKLGVRHVDSRDFELDVVEVLEASPLRNVLVNACGVGGFDKLSPELFEQMKLMSVDAWIGYGHSSPLGGAGSSDALRGDVPEDAPAELRNLPFNAGARTFLDASMRSGVVCMDFKNRRAGFYNEGLAYGHTYEPAVDRYVRHVQIFGQETQEFPAFAGMAHAWFPALGGYAEGGVPITAWWGPQMDALRAKAKEQGIEPLTPAERQRLLGDKAEQTPEAERAALAAKQRAYWRTEQRIGYHDSLKLWADNLREVRGDLVTTISDNAGHDSGKGIVEWFSATDMVTYEHYTDFGDWPNSTGWTIDWAHAVSGGKPVYHNLDPANDNYALFAKAMYDFSRGAEGIAVALAGERNNKIRAKYMKFFKQYGPVATNFHRNSDVAILHNEIQKQAYDTHALHHHLMRLGYAPLILSERTVENSGVPRYLKAIVIPNLRVPFSDQCEKGLELFIARGGKVIIIGEKPWKIQGATIVEAKAKTLWDIGGFVAHLPFWQEFHRLKPTLVKAMADAGLQPHFGAEPEKAMIVPFGSGGMQYVAVMASPADTDDQQFAPVKDVKVKVGKYGRVVNLVTGRSLEVKDGQVTLDLVSEPAALLAMLSQPPRSIAVQYAAAAKLGQKVEWGSEVSFLPDRNSAPRLPVELTLTGPDGKVRATFYRLSSQKVQYVLARNDAAGDYTLTATDLVTGLVAKATMKVSAAAADSFVATVPEVHYPHADRVRQFVSRKAPLRILVEETQDDKLANAKRLADALTKAGRPATVQRISPQSFDTYPLRWFPGKVENAIMDRVRTGEIIGFRGNLNPFIDRAKRAFIAERGGWADLDPAFIVRDDVIVFSGGRMADSLKVVTDWMDSPNVPGNGQAIVEIVLSPFWANCDALAIVANDAPGSSKAVADLLKVIDAAAVTPAHKFPAPSLVKADATASSETAVALAKPLKGLVPPAKAKRLLASSDGYAAALVDDKAFIVSPQGKVLHVVKDTAVTPQIAQGGRYCFGEMEVLARHPAWHFPIEWRVNLNMIDPAGTIARVGAADIHYGDPDNGWDSGFLASPDGKTYFSGRPGGGFVLYDLGKKVYRIYEPPTSEARFADGMREAVSTLAAAYSSNSRYVAYSVGCYPAGYGGMMGPPLNPYATAVRLVDVDSGKVLWQRGGKDLEDSSFSGINPCIAVSNDGKIVAYVDYHYNARILDAKGQEIAAKMIVDGKAAGFARRWPNPLKTQISADGGTLLFAAIDQVLLTDSKGEAAVQFRVPFLCDVAMSADGKSVYAADIDGRIVCFDRAGARKWAYQTTGEAPKLAALQDGLLVAEGAGNLVKIDPLGKGGPKLALTADAQDLPAKDLAFAGKGTYVEPQTLSVLQAKAGAKEVARLELKGEAKDAYGRKFFAVSQEQTLEVSEKGTFVVHMVYRHAKGTKVTIAANMKDRTFELDLPTPEYRVVNLPVECKDGLKVKIAPSEGLEVAEVSVHQYTMPGVNGAFIRPANAELGGGEGVSLDDEEEARPEDTVLDDKDPTQMAKATHGKVKNVAIYSVNTDVDKVSGPYFTNGNGLDTFDGFKFDDAKCSPWTFAAMQFAPFMGSKLTLTMPYTSKPRLCATYDRSLKQSELMRAMAICTGKKADLADPEIFVTQPRAAQGVYNNDQFFNVFVMEGSELEVLCVFVSGAGDLGLSEVELHE